MLLVARKLIRNKQSWRKGQDGDPRPLEPSKYQRATEATLLHIFQSIKI